MGISTHLWAITAKRAQMADVGGATRTLTVATVRGTIYDRKMIPLTNKSNEYRAAILPNEELISLVKGAMTTTNYLSLLERLEKGEPAIARLTKPIPLAQGMRLFLTPLRYGDKAIAPHVLGYLDNSSQQGVTGVEAAFDEVLASYSGRATVSFSVNGNGGYLQTAPLEITNTLDNKTGGVALTLDSELQMIAEECAEHVDKGAILLLNGDTGSVLACASFPSFHPLSVEESIRQNEGALVNRALRLYDCGSVFKIVTAAAALEYGVSPLQEYCCDGGMTVGNTSFHCHDRLGHQTMDMSSAFAQSCNLYFIQLAQQVGETALLNMAYRLGLGEEIELIEGMHATAGVLPSEQELKTPAALANFSFGQGKLLLSPLHIARLTAIVANGGYLPPLQLFKGYVNEKGELTAAAGDERGERVLSESTVHTLQNMMRSVVEEGTGQNASVEGVAVAGKTGTAQTGQYNGGIAVIQSWFTGYFILNDENYIITVLAEDCETTHKSATKAACELINKLIEKEKEQTD